MASQMDSSACTSQRAGLLPSSPSLGQKPVSVRLECVCVSGEWRPLTLFQTACVRSSSSSMMSLLSALTASPPFPSLHPSPLFYVTFLWSVLLYWAISFSLNPTASFGISLLLVHLFLSFRSRPLELSLCCHI